MWKELAQEFPVVFDQCVEQTIWNTVRDTDSVELKHPLTQVEEMRIRQGSHMSKSLTIGSGTRDRTVLRLR